MFEQTDDLALNPQDQEESDKWKIANNTGVPPSLQGKPYQYENHVP